ncbi:Peroxidase 52 [Castilleja foliolosa]|uniref:peroxidase n=1 Tax=Castilleja foliolosa TaxID=1961234 RepID=A0ABD3EGV6_9LAMI
MASISPNCYKVGMILLVILSISSSAYTLSTNFYSTSCPNLSAIVKSVVQNEINKEARMGASLLRLHFHDCFVNGCDASILLDDTTSFKGEKGAVANKNSARGFEVIDQIKAEIEKQCPGKVSCADILTLAARDSVFILGGPHWRVKFGRKDARTASLDDANKGIPLSNWALDQRTNRFNALGLSTNELVALAGLFRSYKR